MSITSDLPVHTDHPTAGPPVAPVLYEYYRGGSLQRKGLPGNANDGLYVYGDDEDHPHAVTGYRGNTYGYAANGNMENRTVDGTSYILTYDAENRLISVVGGGSTVTFTYDGDGNRVKKDEDGVVTHYPGRHYEATKDSGSTKYFPSTPLRTGFADGQLVSFERSPDYGVDNGRRFVFRDHPSISLRTCLGSTSVIVNGRGEKLWEDRYLPGACPERRPEVGRPKVVSRRGDVRYTYRREQEPGLDIVLQTQYRYTSQWFEDGLGASSPVTVDGVDVDRGLYFYGARWYDSSLGRFLQPDTIVPNPGGHRPIPESGGAGGGGVLLWCDAPPIIEPYPHISSDLFFLKQRCYNHWPTHLEETRTLSTLTAVILISQIILSIAVTVLVVLQTQNSGAGGMFGADTTVHRTRRGLEKTLYQASIVVTTLFFVVSLVAASVV